MFYLLLSLNCSHVGVRMWTNQHHLSNSGSGETHHRLTFVFVGSMGQTVWLERASQKTDPPTPRAVIVFFSIGLLWVDALLNTNHFIECTGSFVHGTRRTHTYDKLSHSFCLPNSHARHWPVQGFSKRYLSKVKLNLQPFGCNISFSTTWPSLSNKIAFFFRFIFLYLFSQQRKQCPPLVYRASKARMVSSNQKSKPKSLHVN